jgi:hypothetical protein
VPRSGPTLCRHPCAVLFVCLVGCMVTVSLCRRR